MVASGNELLAQTRSGTTSYYLSDGQGSVRGLTDGNGSVTDSYSYDAFGNLLTSQGSTVNPYRYDGQLYDSLTGLYDLRARYYDPTSGRFLSRDTAGIDVSNPVEVNRYSYAEENPVDLTDPSGRNSSEETGEIDWIDVIIFGGIGIIGVYLTARFLQWLLQLGGFLAGLLSKILAKIGVQSGASGPKISLVADAGIFLDRVSPLERAAIDKAILNNPQLILYVPEAVADEVLPTPTQVARLRGVPGGAQIIIIPNASLAGVAATNPGALIITRNFDRTDMYLLQTAKELMLPVITTNPGLFRQVHSGGAREAEWGDVPIAVV